MNSATLLLRFSFQLGHLPQLLNGLGPETLLGSMHRAGVCQRKMTRRVKRLGLWAPGLFLFYWLMVGKTEVQQILTGAVLGVGTALIQELLREKMNTQFRLQMNWLGVLLRRLPGKIALDIWRLGVVLWEALWQGKRPRGAYGEVHVNPHLFEPREAGRRALLIACICAPPNNFVVAVERQKRLLRIHELTPRKQPATDKEWPL